MTKEKCANEMQKVVKQKTFAEFNNVRHTHTHARKLTQVCYAHIHPHARTHARIMHNTCNFCIFYYICV